MKSSSGTAMPLALSKFPSAERVVAASESSAHNAPRRASTAAFDPRSSARRRRSAPPGARPETRTDHDPSWRAMVPRGGSRP